jgi:hypothetical protein
MTEAPVGRATFWAWGLRRDEPETSWPLKRFNTASDPRKLKILGVGLLFGDSSEGTVLERPLGRGGVLGGE